MNAQERLNYLLEDVSEPNRKAWLAAELPAALGSVQSANVVLGAIEQAMPLTRAAFIALSLPTGLQLWDKGQLIDSLPISSELKDAVKALGVTVRKRWQVEGYETEPTLEQIRKEVAIADCHSTLASRFNAAKATLDTMDLDAMTAEEVEALCESLLEGN